MIVQDYRRLTALATALDDEGREDAADVIRDCALDRLWCEMTDGEREASTHAE